MSLLTDAETTREDIALALGFVNASAKRTPSHYPDKAKWHAELDALLTEWEAAP